MEMHIYQLSECLIQRGHKVGETSFDKNRAISNVLVVLPLM